MNPKGANSILGSKVKLGAGDALRSRPGPKGTAQQRRITDILMRAEVLSYSSFHRGLFAGISLEGSTAPFRTAVRTKKALWAKALSAKEIVREGQGWRSGFGPRTRLLVG